jgi:hypothetical protein
VDKLLYIQINRRTLRREGLFKVEEEEDTDADTTTAGPAYTTEAAVVEDVSV